MTFKGKYHTVEDAGINPRPASGRVPLWYGGHHEHTLPRIAKWGDGWMPNAYPPDQSALDVFGELRRLTEQAGRDPASVGIEVWTSCGEGAESRLAKGSDILEAGRRQPYLPDHHVQSAPSSSHSWPRGGRPFGSDEALPRGYRRSALACLCGGGRRVAIPATNLTLSSAPEPIPAWFVWCVLLHREVQMRFTLLIVPVLMMIGLSACQQEGPAEKAGKSLRQRRPVRVGRIKPAARPSSGSGEESRPRPGRVRFVTLGAGGDPLDNILPTG